ncbi:hypothetical protein CHF27_012815 [Romboutsia maritimum]|uniref:Uncharacterized protein n=1 Tax=Romboutsia maritimum TaxID=2020948 RepID=A0A371IPZ8_9FIRM|nr:hypothetical protein [Romboutsia maritimum]RDY22555.1 hypothetical protein CHF27_012815 [Romboutsia maritimum]
MILQKQFIKILVQLGVAKYEFDAIKSISEMERAEIIKKIKYSNTNSKFILFKKYAIRYLANAKKSSEVASLTTVNSNKRYVENILKTQFILNIIIPSMKKRGLKLSVNDFLGFLDNINCNLLHSANNMTKYYKNLIANKSIVIDDDYLYNSNIATLARKNIFIAHIEYNSITDNTKIRVYYFNTSKDKNSYATTLNYSICYNTMKRLFGKNILLEFNVITLNNLIKDGLIEELNKKGINPRTKEKKTESYLIEMLRANRLCEIDFERMKIKIISYDIK